jgi:hypothetical protein
VYFTAIGLSA